MQRFKNSQAYNNSWHFRSIIGKQNFLEKSTRSDIAYAVHQCARLSSDPKIEDAEAIESLAKYLAGIKDKGIIIKPITEPILEVM